ncbi:MAG: hypothetical protein AAGE84_24480 [Cyanobacteria bacterium P01_G01_bin.39]
MTTYKQEPKPVYEAPKVEEKEAPKAEYQYPEYQPVAEYMPASEYQPTGEYQSTEYWKPAYEDIQEKYSGEKYAEKQYITEKETEAYGKDTADYLVANKKDNLIETYKENDVVEAGYGNDKIDTGEGDDWLWGISKGHNATEEKYSEEEYMEVDWYTSGAGQDIYALGTEKHAHYATNGAKDYAVITDYTAEDTVMLHGTAENYVVGESATKTEDPAMMEKTAAIYWDKDANGSYSEGDDMVAVFEGYSVEEITVAKDSWMYVTETPVA